MTIPSWLRVSISQSWPLSTPISCTNTDVNNAKRKALLVIPLIGLYILKENIPIPFQKLRYYEALRGESLFFKAVPEKAHVVPFNAAVVI